MIEPDRDDPEVHQPEDEESDYFAPYFDSEFEDAVQGEKLLGEEEC